MLLLELLLELLLLLLLLLLPLLLLHVVITVSDRLQAVSDESILNSKISNFNWPGLGHRRGRPPFRPVGADRRSEAGPSPGQLKFEIFRKIG